MRKKEVKDKVILNKPIENEENDWIGVSVYVDKIKSAIEQGANMIAITSDFGSGKSSLISLLEKRIEKIKYKKILCLRKKYKIYKINMWNVLNNNSDTTSIELHKSFVYNLSSQMNRKKGSYISKRLSKNYGLFKIDTGRTFTKIVFFIALLAVGIGEGIRRFSSQLNGLFPNCEGTFSIIKYLAYVIAAILLFLLLINTDIIFSTRKSEGNREIDENTIIDFYRNNIIWSILPRHIIIVIEDLDRTDKDQVVLEFLKELRKYYVPERKRFFDKKVTIIVNIKPEAMLWNPKENDRGNNKEHIYPKFFEYIIDLKKINIDNYDSILEGILIEHREELERYNIINPEEKIDINKIPGMNWIIRGKSLDIREIKERLMNALLIYGTLIDKFGNEGIEFEKCAVVAYVTTEFSGEFYKTDDRKFEELVEKFISGELVEEEDYEKALFDGEVSQKQRDYVKEIKNLIENKHIDSTYRTYFYNYPKKSKIYNANERIVQNAIIYKEDIRNPEKFNNILESVSPNIINEALNKVVSLNLALPTCVIEYEKIYREALKNYETETIYVIAELDYSENNIKKTLTKIKKLLGFDNTREIYNERIAQIIVEQWNNIGVNRILDIRKMLCDNFSKEICWYKQLFFGDNILITKDEINLLGNLENILQLIDYTNDSEDRVEVYQTIHVQICENKCTGEIYRHFYASIYNNGGANYIADYICDYFCAIDYIDEKLENIVIDEIENGDITSHKYIETIEKVSDCNERISENIVKIKWTKGLGKKNLEKLRDSEEWYYFIINAAEENIELIDFGKKEVIEIITNNVESFIEDNINAWNSIRIKVLKSHYLIEKYIDIFDSRYQPLSEEELDSICEIDDAIVVLKMNKISLDMVEYISDYFGKKYRKSSETYAILKYVLDLDKDVSKEIFCSLDMDNVRYRLMSKAKRMEIIQLYNKRDIFNSANEILRYMQIVKFADDYLNKKIKTIISSDEDLGKHYITIVNEMDKIERSTIDNILNMRTKYAYSDTINNKLYDQREYITYVISTTLGKRKFEVEENRKNILWNTYKKIFVDGVYKTTIGYMIENVNFIKQLFQENVYLEVEKEQLLAFNKILQTKDIIKYIFDKDEETIIEYFSNAIGFVDKNAASTFVDEIEKKNKLLISSKIYNNIHDKLVDPVLKGKYTRCQKKARREANIDE